MDSMGWTQLPVRIKGLVPASSDVEHQVGSEEPWATEPGGGRRVFEASMSSSPPEGQVGIWTLIEVKSRRLSKCGFFGSEAAAHLHTPQPGNQSVVRESLDSDHALGGILDCTQRLPQSTVAFPAWRVTCP